MSESLSVRFLYGTAVGRSFLRILTAPGISRAVGAFLDRRASRVFIKGFMRRNGITLDDIDVPNGGFASFNDFFTRKKQHTDVCTDPHKLISPCDGYLTCFRIDKSSVFKIKNSSYSVSDLLCDCEIGKCYRNGYALIFRLTPADYHRYIFFDSGEVLHRRRINGILHCVRPLATEAFPVYIQNSREYTLLRTDNFGDAVMIEIGALFVGRIVNREVKTFTRGEEKGKFEFGGSTVILLLEENSINVRDSFFSDKEKRVHIGEPLADLRNR